ncbi:MDR family MFS transporter [Gryllotalpicola protaetiae]|uniref:DHA2 family efflux MFS transporter permease subunit n=1 Tax=Gryllotalpicola protaetiae TaxID=2419771 RepID=A0A387BQX3_9MICO|nr:MDR family MFS transporter [Gryllotalpicola protaetiae]AYG03376.1 DHA2 family efflux MFS transporter permease subunit [Gryllotalpicola protaetiae]
MSTATVDSKIDPAAWRSVWAVLVGALAVIFDTTIVAVALHTLATDLHTSVATIQWVSTGYLLALGVTIPITGWAQRILGAKRLWIIALSVFLIGSILSSLAWDAPSLIAFRIVQGVGGGIMLPLMSTIVMQAAGGKNLGQIMSVVSLPAVLGPILGPVIGGIILSHLHWSFLFWVNVPFCVVGLVLAAIMLPKDGPVRRAPFDLVGFVLMAPALVALLDGLSNTSKDGGFSRADVIWPLVIGVVLLVAFVAWALRRKARALIDLMLLKHWPLSSSSILLFLSGITLYGAMLVLPLYFQQLRGMTPLEAGLLLIPQGVGTFISRSFAGRLSDRIGSRWLAIAGFAIVALGTLPFAFAGLHTNEIWLMAALLVRGFGLGIVTVPLMALAFRGLERAEVPDASIISRIATQVGGAFGTAVLAVILEGALNSATSSGGAVAAFQGAFWWSIGFAAVGVGLAFLLPGKAPVAAAPGAAVAASAAPAKP